MTIMQINLVLEWWHVPAIITFLCVLWLVFWPHKSYHSNYLPDTSGFWRFLLVLIFTLAAWALSGMLK